MKCLCRKVVAIVLSLVTAIPFVLGVSAGTIWQFTYFGITIDESTNKVEINGSDSVTLYSAIFNEDGTICHR